MSTTGYYFDEVTGSLATSTLTLRSVVDLSAGSTINVNVLTTLEKKRLRKNRKDGKSFRDSKVDVQRDVRTVFHIAQAATLDSQFQSIVGQGSDDAALLAVSAILQLAAAVRAPSPDKVTAELSQLIALLETDLEQDGVVDTPGLVAELEYAILGGFASGVGTLSTGVIYQ